MSTAVAERRERATKPVASATTARAVAFVAEHRAAARVLGRGLGDAIGEPDRFATDLRRGLADLADPAYRDGQALVAPGIGTTLGIRTPLLGAVASGLRAATRRDRPAPLLAVADRLLREDYLEAHWLAFGLLGRLGGDDPERAWQLLRRAARTAGDWITIDTLARPYAIGVLDAPYRWAELEQLVFSASRWERRLVASTIAALPHEGGDAGRTRDVVEQGLALLGRLIGDAEPDVQKALAWAYRPLAEIDPALTLAALERETGTASETGDGHRAWVVRDALAKLPAADAARLRDRLAGIRRAPGAPSTSEAAAVAARFGELPDPRHHPEPPLT